MLIVLLLWVGLALVLSLALARAAARPQPPAPTELPQIDLAVSTQTSKPMLERVSALPRAQKEPVSVS